MKTYFLARIGGQLFALDKEAVVGVAIRDIEKTKPVFDHNRYFLPLTNGRRALICNLQSFLISKITSKTRLSHYLVLSWLGAHFAIPMNDRGCLASIDEKSWRHLPPLFNGLDRKVVENGLVTGTDLLLLLDLAGLTRVFNDLSPQAALAA